MRHQGTTTIHTDRLTLRPFVAADAAALFANWADTSQAPRFSWPRCASPAEANQVVVTWLPHYADPAFYLWAIVPADAGQAVGCMSAQVSDEKTGEVEVAFSLGQAWWGQGITSEALAAVLDYLFDQVGARRVWCRCDGDDPTAAGVMRHCGLTFEGTLRQDPRQGEVDAEPAGTRLYGILAEDHAAARHAAALGATGRDPRRRGTKTPQDSRTVTTHLLRHEDINGANRLFGGRIMEWIDDAAGIAAKRHCGAEIITASVDTLEFRAPAYQNDIVAIEATVTYVGNSSLEVRVESFVEDVVAGSRALINKAYLTEVCVDDSGHPITVPYGLALSTTQEWQEWEAALFRREMHHTRSKAGI